MEEYRSRSYHDSRMQVVETYGYSFSNPNPDPNRIPPGPQDLRCYSASYASSNSYNNNNNNNGEIRDVNLKKGKSVNGWVFSDPELQRKKRVASYKAYAVEGKLKGSIKNSFRWIKDKYNQVIYGRR